MTRQSYWFFIFSWKDQDTYIESLLAKLENSSAEDVARLRESEVVKDNYKYKLSTCPGVRFPCTQGHFVPGQVSL